MTPNEAIKNLEKPKGRWGAILATTPIVMTVLATVFAGLSSSEMTQAMFHRSLASQQQSKAGDQWAFFQAKRGRGTVLESNIELLQTLARAEPLNSKAIPATLARLSSIISASSLSATEKMQALAKLKALQDKFAPFLDSEYEVHWSMLTSGPLPKIDIPKLHDPTVQKQLDAALESIALKKNEEEIYQLVKQLSPAVVEEAIRSAERTSEQFSQSCEPTAEFGKRLKGCLLQADGVSESLEEQLSFQGTDRRHPLSRLNRQLAGARVALNDFDARRYRQESFYNRKVAELYELRVWRSGMESDRHRIRSQLFFYSMLVAQIGVTISSLALAQAKRSALWFVAAIAGIVALGFSAWVYLSR